LLESADHTHELLEDWSISGNTEIIQIAGWGLKTVRGIEYDDCDIIFCPDKLSNLDREVKMTHVGDGTVVLPSAIVMDGEENVKTYYVDVRSHNQENIRLRRNRTHADILEISSLQEFIVEINKNKFELTDDIYDSQPELKNGDIDLNFKLHSPVALHLYDSEQNHTGLWDNDEHEGRFYEAAIPNSYYKQYGEVKYAGGTGVRRVELIGEDLGIFTLEIDKTFGDDIINSEVFRDIPVTASTYAEIFITEEGVVEDMAMDIDGDGEDDLTIYPGEEVDTLSQLQILREVIEMIDMGHGARTALLQHALQSEKSYEKGNWDQSIRSLEQMEHDIEVFSKKAKNEKQRIGSDDAEQLTNIILTIKTNIHE